MITLRPENQVNLRLTPRRQPEQRNLGSPFSAKQSQAQDRAVRKVSVQWWNYNWHL
jgi:hypothetical protein